MSPNVMVFSRSEELLADLRLQLEGKHHIIACQSLDTLHDVLKAQPVGAVLVHLDQSTLNGYSPGRFIAELDEATEEAPLYGIFSGDCPPRLRKLAQKAVDDCLETPLDYQQLRRLLDEKQDIEDDLAGFWNGVPHKELHGRSRSLITFTPEMFGMIEEIKVAARHNVTALLVGETGCGKTFLARLIHELSDRREERFCTVACGALPPDLIESELFGYVKGAFTGADREREGKFAAAGKGTLLLDEIDVLTPEQQAKLLRVIETGEYEQVGSNETQISQARLVVASNYDLEDLVRRGGFRTDLYYRLNILNFRLPPLRERPLDMEYLARKFALEHSRTHNIPLRSIDPAFLDALRRYHWPGNVREMENVIRRAVLYCHRGVLTLGDLPSSIRAAVAGVSTSFSSSAVSLAPTPYPTRDAESQFQGPIPGGMGALLPQDSFGGTMQRGGYRPSLPFVPPPPAPYAMSQGGEEPRQQSAGVASAASATGGGASPAASLEARVDVMERRIIEDCLKRNNFRRKETAAELGISRVTLYNKMKKYGML